MKLSLFAITAALMALSTSVAQAHFDVTLGTSGGKLITGGQDHTTDPATVVSNLRVYGYDFGEDASDPYTISDPGFGAASGSGVASGNLIFVVTSNLLYWDGASASVTFTPAASDISLTIYKATMTSSVTVTGTGSTGSVTLGSISSTGYIHTHSISTISSSDDTVDTGVYAVQGYLKAADGTTSDPIWIVYNNGLTEEQHDSAMSYLETTLVPEPAALTTLGIGALALLSRRKR